jgi:hypothetical protein
MQKMKISKTSWLILVVGVFGVAIAALGLLRTQQIRAESELKDNLSVAETRLEKMQVKDLSQQVSDLQAKLEESKTLLAAAQDKMTQPVESIEVTDRFFAMAKSCNVEVQTIGSSTKKSKSLEGVGCSTITLNASVQGSVANLINFVIKLNTDYATGIVETAQITIPASTETGSGGMPSIDIMMTIYSYARGEG